MAPTPPQTMQGKTISGFSANGTIKRSDFNFGASKFNAMLGDDVKFTVDVEIDKQ
jgi:polyisoprenoid-binding protein YceI